MAGKKRDEFSREVVRTVAERGAYICSNPDCRDWTVQPHSDPEKSLKTGEAAHIRAASPGGPRYEALQTPEERSSILNAIWLCTKCSTLIDKDEMRYPVELLIIDALLQLSEPVVATWWKESPPGVSVHFHPKRPEVMAYGTGTVTRNRPPLPSAVFLLRVDQLPPRQALEIALYTSMKAHEEQDITFQTGPFAELMKGDCLLHFIDGTFQFEYRGTRLTKKFFAPIRFDKDARTMSVVEVRGDKGDWEPLEMILMS